MGISIPPPAPQQQQSPLMSENSCEQQNTSPPESSEQQDTSPSPESREQQKTSTLVGCDKNSSIELRIFIMMIRLPPESLINQISEIGDWQCSPIVTQNIKQRCCGAGVQFPV